jgi:hypothetical protein
LPTAFRYETELAAPALRHFRRRGDWDFAHELVALRAAPDLVAGRRAPTFAARAAGPPPVTNGLVLRLLEFAAAGVGEAELRAWAPWGWRDLKKRALEPALAAGLIEFVDGRWQAPQLQLPYGELVAIELKLRDWRKGIRQSRANQAFAAEAWLVMPNPPDEALKLASWVGVGLVGVAEGGTTQLVAAAVREPLSPFASRLFGELVYEQALEQRLPGAEKLRPLAGSPRGRKLAVSV